MKSKATLILAVAVLLLGAATLTASDWVGTYTGDDQGVIEGTLNEAVDPPIYQGTWASYIDYEHNYGTWYGTAELVGDWFIVEDGEIYDDTNTLVGYWSGSFPSPNIDGIASGEWFKFNGWSGDWSAYRP
jgi:hypothetical protein